MHEFPSNAISQYKKRHGRSRKTTPLTDHLKLAVNRYRRLIAEDLKKLHPKLLKDVAICTIQHHLKHHLGTLHCMAACKPLLTGIMWCKRLPFSRDHKNLSMVYWQKVLWSDKSSFQVIIIITVKHSVSIKKLGLLQLGMWRRWTS